jgi:hypothetical protein
MLHSVGTHFRAFDTGYHWGGLNMGYKMKRTLAHFEKEGVNHCFIKTSSKWGSRQRGCQEQMKLACTIFFDFINWALRQFWFMNLSA